MEGSKRQPVMCLVLVYPTKWHRHREWFISRIYNCSMWQCRTMENSICL